MADLPLSVGPQPGFNRNLSSIPHLASTSGSGPTKSHYRRVSSQPSYRDIDTGQPSLRRSASLGGLHQFCNSMGLQFGSRGKRELVRPTAVLPSVLDAPSSLRPTIKSMFVASDPYSAPPSPSPKCSDELPVINISKEHVSYEELDASEKFVPKNTWAKRANMKLHPYHQQVAYMQAYDPISLETDRYTDLLFQRLTNGSPSFHDYGKMPPAVVLDLGCGQGHWISHAANIWRNTEFVGMDIVDTTLPTLDTAENVKLVRGDFVNYKFPFPDDSFDFVRMANLALCIPYDKWEFVLGQVHRVLTPGGRLELIDDDIYFPYGEWNGVELDAVVSGSPLFGEGAGMDNEMKRGEGTDVADPMLMNREAPIISEAADSAPVTLLSKSADLLARSCTSKSRNSASSCSPRGDSLSDTLRTQDLTSRYVRTGLKSTRTPIPADWQQRSGLKSFTRPTTPQTVPPSLTARKDGNWNSMRPCPKRTREKVALLPPIRSITPAFLLLSGSKYSPTWSLRTANTSSTESDTSSIRTTDTSPTTSIGTVTNKVDPKKAEWQRSVSASKNMESVFEKMLVEQYGIHPRPSEFMLRVLGKVFHEDGNDEVQVRMTKSFHIELAPTGDQPGSAPVGWKDGSVEDSDGMASSSTEMKTTVEAISKTQKRNDVAVSTLRPSPWQVREKKVVDRPRGKKEKDEDKKNKSKHEERVGRQFELKKTQPSKVKTTATMSVSLFKRSQLQDPALSTPIMPALSAKAAGILGIPYSELSWALSLSLSEEKRSTVMPLHWSGASNLSAKAAGRLGITYSESLSAAASFPVPRNAAHPPVPSSIPTFPPTSSEPTTSSHIASGTVQHPGLLIWPDTYVPMPAGELEMHACKYIHTLLGCRPALEEFIAKFVDEKGDRFIGEEEFRDEIWEYECFRRARFNWPSEAADPYEDDPTIPNAFGPSSPVPCTIPDNSGAGTSGSIDANHPIASTMDLPPIRTSTVFIHRTCTTNEFGGFPNEKSLQPTNTSLLLRAMSPTDRRSPRSSFMPLKGNSHISRDLRSASPVLSSPSPPPFSRKDTSDKLYQSTTERNRGYRKLDELVHLRSIRVFEGVKAA